MQIHCEFGYKLPLLYFCSKLYLVVITNFLLEVLYLNVFIEHTSVITFPLDIHVHCAFVLYFCTLYNPYSTFWIQLETWSNCRSVFLISLQQSLCNGMDTLMRCRELFIYTCNRRVVQLIISHHSLPPSCVPPASLLPHKSNLI